MTHLSLLRLFSGVAAAGALSLTKPVAAQSPPPPPSDPESQTSVFVGAHAQRVGDADGKGHNTVMPGDVVSVVHERGLENGRVIHVAVGAAVNRGPNGAAIGLGDTSVGLSGPFREGTLTVAVGHDRGNTGPISDDASRYPVEGKYVHLENTLGVRVTHADSKDRNRVFVELFTGAGTAPDDSYDYARPDNDGYGIGDVKVGGRFAVNRYIEINKKTVLDLATGVSFAVRDNYKVEDGSQVIQLPNGEFQVVQVTRFEDAAPEVQFVVAATGHHAFSEKLSLEARIMLGLIRNRYGLGQNDGGFYTADATLTHDLNEHFTLYGGVGVTGTNVVKGQSNTAPFVFAGVQFYPIEDKNTGLTAGFLFKGDGGRAVEISLERHF